MFNLFLPGNFSKEKEKRELVEKLDPIFIIETS